MPAVRSKSLFASKTFWVNAITTGIAVLTAVNGQEWVADHPQLTAGLVAAIGAANIMLRVVTTLPIE